MKMGLYSKRLYIRLISISILICFLGTNLSYAEPRPAINAVPIIFQTDLSTLINQPATLDIPYEFATVKEVYKADSDKLIIHIQDPHANYSGQKNLAHTLDYLLKRYDIPTVMVEGSSKDASLNHVHGRMSAKDLELASKQLLYYGIISGEEHLNLISKHKMRLLGIEDQVLYDENLRVYKKIIDVRENAIDYIRTLNQALSQIKNQLYPKELLDYEAGRTQSQVNDDSVSLDNTRLPRPKNGLAMTDANNEPAMTDANNEPAMKNAKMEYPSRTQESPSLRAERGNLDSFAHLLSVAKSSQLELSQYPSIIQYQELSEHETLINFGRVNEELAHLLTALNHTDMTQDLKEYQSPISQYHWLENINTLAKASDISTSAYAELGRYRSYLLKFKELDFANFLSDMDTLEQSLYAKHLLTDDTKKLRAIDRYLQLLDKAYLIQMTTDDTELFNANKADFETRSTIAFLNLKLAELNKYENILEYDSSLDDSHQDLTEFYDVVNQRDFAFINNAKSILRDQNTNISFLISGGYHTDHLNTLLKQQNISYITLTPKVISETNHTNYEKLLFTQNSSSDNTLRQTGAIFGAALRVHYLQSIGSRLSVSALKVVDMMNWPTNLGGLSYFGHRYTTHEVATDDGRITFDPTKVPILRDLPWVSRDSLTPLLRIKPLIFVDKSNSIRKFYVYAKLIDSENKKGRKELKVYEVARRIGLSNVIEVDRVKHDGEIHYLTRIAQSYSDDEIYYANTRAEDLLIAMIFFSDSDHDPNYQDRTIFNNIYTRVIDGERRYLFYDAGYSETPKGINGLLKPLSRQKIYQKLTSSDEFRRDFLKDMDWEYIQKRLGLIEAQDIPALKLTSKQKRLLSAEIRNMLNHHAITGLAENIQSPSRLSRLLESLPQGVLDYFWSVSDMLFQNRYGKHAMFEGEVPEEIDPRQVALLAELYWEEHPSKIETDYIEPSVYIDRSNPKRLYYAYRHKKGSAIKVNKERNELTVSATAKEVGLSNVVEVKSIGRGVKHRVLTRIAQSYSNEEILASYARLEDLLLSMVFFADWDHGLDDMEYAFRPNIHTRQLDGKQYYLSFDSHSAKAPKGLQGFLSDSQREGIYKAIFQTRFHSEEADRLDRDYIAKRLGQIKVKDVRALSLNDLQRQLLSAEVWNMLNHYDSPKRDDAIQAPARMAHWDGDSSRMTLLEAQSEFKRVFQQKVDDFLQVLSEYVGGEYQLADIRDFHSQKMPTIEGRYVHRYYISFNDDKEAEFYVKTESQTKNTRDREFANTQLAHEHKLAPFIVKYNDLEMLVTFLADGGQLTPFHFIQDSHREKTLKVIASMLGELHGLGLIHGDLAYLLGSQTIIDRHIYIGENYEGGMFIDYGKSEKFGIDDVLNSEIEKLVEKELVIAGINAYLNKSVMPEMTNLEISAFEEAYSKGVDKGSPRMADMEGAATLKLTGVGQIANARERELDFDTYLAREGFGEYPHLSKLLLSQTDEMQRVREALMRDEVLRPVIAQVLSSAKGERGEIEVWNKEALDKVGGRALLEAHAAFKFGNYEQVDDFLGRGNAGDIELIVGLTDKLSEDTLISSYPVANGRQIYYPLTRVDGIEKWLGVLGSGQNLDESRPPWFRNDKVSAEVTQAYTGLVPTYESDIAKRSSAILRDATLYASAVGSVYVNSAPNGYGDMNDVKGLRNEKRKSVGVKMIFNITSTPHRVSKLPQLLKVDPELKSLRGSLSPGLTVEGGKTIGMPELMLHIARAMGRQEAEQQRNDLYAPSIHFQDFNLAGQRHDMQELLPKDLYMSVIKSRDAHGDPAVTLFRNTGLHVLGLNTKLTMLANMIRYLKHDEELKSQVPNLFPDPKQIIFALFDGYFEALRGADDKHVQLWLADLPQDLKAYKNPHPTIQSFLGIELDEFRSESDLTTEDEWTKKIFETVHRLAYKHLAKARVTDDLGGGYVLKVSRMADQTMGEVVVNILRGLGGLFDAMSRGKALGDIETPINIAANQRLLSNEAIVFGEAWDYLVEVLSFQMHFRRIQKRLDETNDLVSIREDVQTTLIKMRNLKESLKKMGAQALETERARSLANQPDDSPAKEPIFQHPDLYFIPIANAIIGATELLLEKVDTQIDLDGDSDFGSGNQPTRMTSIHTVVYTPTAAEVEDEVLGENLRNKFQQAFRSGHQLILQGSEFNYQINRAYNENAYLVQRVDQNNIAYGDQRILKILWEADSRQERFDLFEELMAIRQIALERDDDIALRMLPEFIYFDRGIGFVEIAYVEGNPLNDVKNMQARQYYLLAFAKDMLHMHAEYNLFHNDIDKGNIIIRPDQLVGLIDFDYARVYSDRKGPITDITLADKYYDIGSIAMIIISMYASKFNETDIWDLVKQAGRDVDVLDRDRREWIFDEEVVPKELRHLLSKAALQHPTEHYESLNDFVNDLEVALGDMYEVRASPIMDDINYHTPSTEEVANARIGEGLSRQWLEAKKQDRRLILKGTKHAYEILNRINTNVYEVKRVLEDGGLSVDKSILKTLDDKVEREQQFETFEELMEVRASAAFMDDEVALRMLPEFLDLDKEMGLVETAFIEGKSLGEVDSEEDKAFYIFQFAQDLGYMHDEYKLFHNDISASNIIIQPDGTLRLIDFDYARIYFNEEVPVQDLYLTDKFWDISSIATLIALIYTDEVDDPPVEALFKRQGNMIDIAAHLGDPAFDPKEVPAPLVDVLQEAFLQHPSTYYKTLSKFAADLEKPLMQIYPSRMTQQDPTRMTSRLLNSQLPDRDVMPSLVDVERIALASPYASSMSYIGSSADATGLVAFKGNRIFNADGSEKALDTSQARLRELRQRNMKPRVVESNLRTIQFKQKLTRSIANYRRGLKSLSRMKLLKSLPFELLNDMRSFSASLSSNLNLLYELQNEAQFKGVLTQVFIGGDKEQAALDTYKRALLEANVEAGYWAFVNGIQVISMNEALLRLDDTQDQNTPIRVFAGGAKAFGDYYNVAESTFRSLVDSGSVAIAPTHEAKSGEAIDSLNQFVTAALLAKWKKLLPDERLAYAEDMRQYFRNTYQIAASLEQIDFLAQAAHAQIDWYTAVSLPVLGEFDWTTFTQLQPKLRRATQASA